MMGSVIGGGASALAIMAGAALMLGTGRGRTGLFIVGAVMVAAGVVGFVVIFR